MIQIMPQKMMMATAASINPIQSYAGGVSSSATSQACGVWQGILPCWQESPRQYFMRTTLSTRRLLWSWDVFCNQPLVTQADDRTQPLLLVGAVDLQRNVWHVPKFVCLTNQVPGRMHISSPSWLMLCSSTMNASPPASRIACRLDS